MHQCNWISVWCTSGVLPLKLGASLAVVFSIWKWIVYFVSLCSENTLYCFHNEILIPWQYVMCCSSKEVSFFAECDGNWVSWTGLFSRWTLQRRSQSQYSHSYQTAMGNSRRSKYRRFSGMRKKCLFSPVVK